MRTRRFYLALLRKRRIGFAVLAFTLLFLRNGQLVGTQGDQDRQESALTAMGAGVTAISAGWEHSVILKDDGTVWTWGLNDGGQVGDGTTENRSAPYQVSGISDAIAVAAGGGWRTMVLKRDGTVWGWGWNNDGDIGDGTTIHPRTTPVQAMGGQSGVIAIAAGGVHGFALKSDGTVWGWGKNNYGQVGDGTTENRPTPVQLKGLTGVVAMAGGIGWGYHSLALKSNGTVWAWGRNGFGQLGDGTTTDRLTPVQVIGLTGVRVIAAGKWHNLALKSDGTVWAWGANTNYQLGDGTITNRSTPVQVKQLTGVIGVAGGGYHSLAIKSDGSVWAWGDNRDGQLGDGTIAIRSTPVRVKELIGVIAIAAGGWHSLALKSDGTAWVWGSNSCNQLGDPGNSTPVQVSGLSGVTAIAAGSEHSLALKSDGTVRAWGWNYFGQLGDGTEETDRWTPVQVKGLTGVIAIASGGAHSLALKNDRTVAIWGQYAALDDTSHSSRSTPIQVKRLTDVKAIAAGSAHNLALKNDGTVWAWGPNTNGQLGDGTNTNRSTPVQVRNLLNMIAIASSLWESSLAVKSDGSVWAWGYNFYGQLGDGTTTDRLIPVRVTGMTSVTAVAGGLAHSLALKGDGTVRAWGYNYNGRLGDGTTTTDHWGPVQVIGLTDVIAISAGDGHSLALKRDGTVWAWGENADGKLGDGTTTNRPSPVQVRGLTDVVALAAGGRHSLALQSDGTIWTWGRNDRGQLGLGTGARSTPSQVSGL